LLIAANGTMTINNFQFFADGGGGGSDSGSTCGGTGAGGSGGAIRLIANRFVHQNNVDILARRGSASASPGRIRFESLDTSAQTVFQTDPPAQRIVGPTPLANPVSPTVQITHVGGAAVPAVPRGFRGDVDIVVPIPGATNIDVETSGIPGGTTVLITVKPRLGAPPISETVPLTTCDSAGSCQATTVIDLAAGTYVVEARATFQTQ
jgi:hypothetical protein